MKKPDWTPTDREPIETGEGWETSWVVPIRFGLELDIARRLEIPVTPVAYRSEFVAGRVSLEDFKHIAVMLECVSDEEREAYVRQVKYEKDTSTKNLKDLYGTSRGIL